MKIERTVVIAVSSVINGLSVVGISPTFADTAPYGCEDIIRCK